MDDDTEAGRLSRRAVLGAAGGLAACATISGENGQVEKSELEIENERIVTQFCLDWATRDANLLADYLADDIQYQMFEGRPDIVGREAFIKELDGFLKNLKEVRWEILRTYSIGELVINDRVDHFIGEDEKRSMHFAIAGYFLVRDGKIKIWKDYGIPGGLSQVGGAFTGG
ncbi:MAG: limonene-1,2-epoxide hydrolase family protein [Gammaproteobacteria bacterium]|jgi:limonene-1,2-epoxide hydrolase|nr:limonene-1,2-epoxide hydrolase family protein [Gammaproteobacteria bacterium]MDP6617259.1 limonene-1,2-epoxide hydrolase family protein [Gammaproteobacteria bacterium]MDP6694037.1 limonene-1,2-epoxide hydrolase family protein [Gammaproteobacteria bacterium]